MMRKTGISKSNSKFKFYTDWLERENFPYEVLDWEKDNFDDIKKCSSLILTGGADIYPELYNEPESITENEEYLPARDNFEFRLFDYAMENKYPVLGICRGMQLINCRLNGSLVNDIETLRGTNHRKITQTEDRIHPVKIIEDSLLYNITGKSEGEINSSHHQAVDKPGKGLMVNAAATDGITEGIEWEVKEGKPFLLAIQWHPERFKDAASPFCKNIIERFREETNRN
jgi:putative glutamine amidotransferase